MITHNNQSGQSLIELILTIAVAAILLPALLTGLIASRNGKVQQDQRLQAVALVKEAQEAVRTVRETGWSGVATDGTYHPIISGNTWTIVPGAEVINGFTRQIVIGDVYRDNNGTIVSQSTGSLDGATKQITATVTWSNPLPITISSTSYISRYLNNMSFTKTTVSDFSPATVNGTTITATTGTQIPNDGQIQLAAGGNGDWCQPQNYIISALTLPKQGNTLIATQGAAYVGTGDGTSGVTFADIAITDPPAPATPAASILNTYSSSDQTNAIFSDGTYAYLATNGSSSQIIILDISHTPYTKVGWIDVPSGQAANGIYVSNNIAYVTSLNKLYTYNISTKTGDHTTPLTSIAMWLGFGSTPLAKQVIVINNHAYVGTADTLFGLQSFKVSNNGSSLQLVGVSNLTWQQAAQGLFVNTTGTRAYVAFNSGSGFFSKGFFIVDISPADPPSWWPFPNFYSIVGQYNTGSTDPRGMTVVPGNKAIIVGLGGTQEYQVIDIATESNPVLCGGLSIPSGIGGVASVLEKDADAYSYIITGETNDQFKIILGGSGGGFTSSGTYESPTFDATNSTSFNRFSATIAQPPQTIIQMQVASALPVNNSCSGAAFTYVGPNASTSAFFTPVANSISGEIPFQTTGSYQNPARCFRYKVFFSTTDQTQSPVLYDMTVNYTP